MPAETWKIKKNHLKLTVFEAKTVKKRVLGPFFGEWTGRSPVKIIFFDRRSEFGDERGQVFMTDSRGLQCFLQK